MALFFTDAEGNVFATIDASSPVPAGCTPLEAGATDAAQEKHVPVVDLQRDGHIVHATVGEVEHPMLEDHYIEWIALEADGRLEVHHLKPGQTPATFFLFFLKSGTVYAYCNLHGLWKKTF